MTKFATLFAGLSVLAHKFVKLLKASAKLKKVKTEMVEAIEESKKLYEDGEKVFKNVEKAIKTIASYFTEDSDGGKRLTSQEVKEAITLLTKLSNDGKLLMIQFKKASTEVIEAKTEIQNIIKSLK